MSDNLSKTVIVVDDDSDNVAIFTEYLSMYDFEILGVGYNGKTAFELYQRLRPGVVFLDLMMPEYGGLYGLEMIKRFDPQAKVVIVTADMTDDSRAKMLALGVDAIIYKPFEIKDILLTLEKMEIVS